MPVLPPYQISNEYNVAEIIQHYDINYILDIISNKVNNINYASTLVEPNIIDVLMETFKMMEENEPGDVENIKQIREDVFINITQFLCNYHTIQFSEPNEMESLYTASRYLYDFLVCNRVNYMINFFVTYIMNNTDSLAYALNADEAAKARDTTSTYVKRTYTNPKFGIIIPNISTILQLIGTLDISLNDLFTYAYKHPSIISFLDETYSDNSNTFFNRFYMGPVRDREIEPIMITNISLALQKLIGDKSQQNLAQLLTL